MRASYERPCTGWTCYCWLAITRSTLLSDEIMRKQIKGRLSSAFLYFSVTIKCQPNYWVLSFFIFPSHWFFSALSVKKWKAFLFVRETIKQKRILHKDTERIFCYDTFHYSVAAGYTCPFSSFSRCSQSEFSMSYFLEWRLYDIMESAQYFITGQSKATTLCYDTMRSLHYKETIALGQFFLVFILIQIFIFSIILSIR